MPPKKVVKPKTKTETDSDDSDESNYEGENVNEVENIEEIEEIEEVEEIDEENILSEELEEDVEIVSDGNLSGNDGDDCEYENTRKRKNNSNIITKDDDDADNSDDNEAFLRNAPDEFVLPENRVSTNILTNYERVRLLGIRTSQITQGAKPMIKGVSHLDPQIIAQLELESKMMPVIVIRTLPNRKKEKWFMRELSLKKKDIIYNFSKDDDVKKISKT
jgi:DNA-directed RNA polymerase I, II, and III subunit RPABC2